MPVKHCESAVVVENKPLGNGIFKMIVWWPYPADAGQFFMVRGWDKFPLLSRPISVHDADGERVTFLYVGLLVPEVEVILNEFTFI